LPGSVLPLVSLLLALMRDLPDRVVSFILKKCVLLLFLLLL
jgi:hypothetical protein